MKKGIEYYTDLTIKTFPLLTTLTFVFGYIGFHTFTAIYHLPIINTDISIIASIGLLNITYLGILYITATAKRKPRYSEALFIYCIFNFFLNNPIILSSILVLQIILYVFEVEKERKNIPFAIKRIKAKKYLNLLFWGDLIITIIGVVISFLLDSDFYNLLIVIYVILFFIHRYKRHKQKPNIFKIIILLLFPVITMYYFINSSRTNILGINRQEVDIITKNDTVKTNIIFNDPNYFYTFSDTTKIMTTIRKDDVIKILSTTNKKESKSGLKVFKELFIK